MDGGPPAQYAGIIEVEVDSDYNINNDLPNWVREAVDRALDGLPTNKQASEAVIESLEVASEEELDENHKECAICYEKLIISNSTLSASSAVPTTTGASNVSANSGAGQFNDPSLFFPVVESSAIHTRFPPHCIDTRIAPTMQEMLPESNNKRNRKRVRVNSQGQDDEEVHIAVKMPGCKHVFGKPCIIEWLKSNVSCPLCRKEVQAERLDSKSKKRKEIRERSLFNFTRESRRSERLSRTAEDSTREAKQRVEEAIDHIADRSTDVFRPYRKPYNPRITPLTDRYIPQEWSRPLHSWQQERENAHQLENNTLTAPDPTLVLLRKYPLGDLGEIGLRGGTSTATRSNAPGITTSLNSLFSGGAEQLSEFLFDSGPATSSVRDEVNTVREPLLSRNIQSILRGRGGPERSNRNTTRGHPYSRPDEP